MSTGIRLWHGLVLSLLTVSGSSVCAQSIAIFGGDSYARDCYEAATLAVQLRSASRDDLELCSTAITHGALSLHDLAATYVNRGILHVAREDYQPAVRDYDAALKMLPNIGEAYLNRGNLYFLVKGYEQAVAEYTTALDIGLSRKYVAYYNRGMAHEHLRDLDRAEADYRRALDFVPDWIEPQLKLERVLKKRATARSRS